MDNEPRLKGLKEYQDLDPYVLAWDSKKRTLIHKISSEKKDRVGDIVRIDGIQLTNYRKNPIVLYGHKYVDMDPLPVIGKNIGFQKDSDRKVLFAKTQYHNERKVSPKLADLINDLIFFATELNIAGWSIGFKMLEYELLKSKEDRITGYDFIKTELLEYSEVIIPAHQDAVNNALEAGRITKDYALHLKDRISEISEISENPAEFQKWVESTFYDNYRTQPQDPEDPKADIKYICRIIEDEDPEGSITFNFTPSSILRSVYEGLKTLDSSAIDEILAAKPYPNEHAARLKDPDGFNPDTFRRKKDGTIYGSTKVPNTIAVIWGKLKGSDKPADPPIPQALRFPTKNWTVAAAKKWLKDNKVKYIAFEPADSSKEVEAAVEILTEATLQIVRETQLTIAETTRLISEILEEKIGT